jgi:hypothetical protein
MEHNERNINKSRGKGKHQPQENDDRGIKTKNTKCKT